MIATPADLLPPARPRPLGGSPPTPRKALLVTLGIGSCVLGLPAQVTVTIDFEDSTIEGGSIRAEPNHTPEPITDQFRDPWFDEVSAGTAASFTIENIDLIGTLNVTAEALSDDLNVTDDGLSDGVSGYNAEGDGTTFTFDRDLTVTAIDFTSFTSGGGDEVVLESGDQSVGPIAEGQSVSTPFAANFGETNPATTEIPVSAGDSFVVAWSSGEFWVESLAIQTVPEPSRFGLVAAILALAAALFARRRRR